MKALRLEADWDPRPGAIATLDPADASARIARRGNQVWRNPRITLATLPDPTPGADEVVIRVGACGICGSDLHFVESDADGYMLYPGLVRAPVVTGHEFAGVVEAVGSAVKDFAPGDLVCAEEIAWCGECLACRAGRPNNCTRIEELGFSFDGAHAELVAVRARYCWSLAPLVDAGIPADRILQLGALVEPTGVAYVAMFVSAGGFMPGASVGVVGAGRRSAWQQSRSHGQPARDASSPSRYRRGAGKLRRRWARTRLSTRGASGPTASPSPLERQPEDGESTCGSKPVARQASPRRWPPHWPRPAGWS
jgi:hypothetical protein